MPETFAPPTPAPPPRPRPADPRPPAPPSRARPWAPAERPARQGPAPVERLFYGVARARPDQDGGVGPGLRAGDELPVQRAALAQLLVRAAVGDPALIEDHDPVGQVQRRPPVGDDQRGAPAHDLAQRGVDLGLQARVDGRGRVVQQEQPGVGDQRPGQGHPLPLPAGKRQALLADHGVVALGEPLDELVGLRRLGRGDDLVLGGVRPAVGDVRPHRVGEQEAVLHDHADRGAQ